MKVTKISISPSRTISLGDFESAKLSASIEIELDVPTDNKEEIEKAFDLARSFCKEELKKQYEPFKKKLSN